MYRIIKFEAAPVVTHILLDQAYDQLTVRSAYSELYNTINFEVVLDISCFFSHIYNAHANAAIRLVTTSRKKTLKIVAAVSGYQRLQNKQLLVKVYSSPCPTIKFKAPDLSGYFLL